MQEDDNDCVSGGQSDPLDFGDNYSQSHLIKEKQPFYLKMWIYRSCTKFQARICFECGELHEINIY
jgi:hypothetical protein